MQELVLSKSRDANLYGDEIKTKKIISTKRRPGLEKLIEKAKNQSRKNTTPQVNGELDFFPFPYTGRWSFLNTD